MNVNSEDDTLLPKTTRNRKIEAAEHVDSGTLTARAVVGRGGVLRGWSHRGPSVVTVTQKSEIKGSMFSLEPPHHRER